jgi:hypothetical protein
MNYLSILTNPAVKSPKDEIYTVGIHIDGMPTTKIIPLLDHHSLGSPQIGAVQVTAIPLGRLDETSAIVTYIGNISTPEKLKIGQNVSIGYAVLSHHKSDNTEVHFTTIDAILECSLVDVAHIPGAEIIDPNTLQSVLITKQMAALQEHVQTDSPLPSAALACVALMKAKQQSQDTTEPK